VTYWVWLDGVLAGTVHAGDLFEAEAAADRAFGDAWTVRRISPQGPTP